MILIFNLPPNKDAFTLQTLLLWYLIVCPFSLMICGSQGKFSSVEASGCIRPSMKILARKTLLLFYQLVRRLGHVNNNKCDLIKNQRYNNNTIWLTHQKKVRFVLDENV